MTETNYIELRRQVVQDEDISTLFSNVSSLFHRDMDLQIKLDTLTHAFETHKTQSFTDSDLLFFMIFVQWVILSTLFITSFVGGPIRAESRVFGVGLVRVVYFISLWGMAIGWFSFRSLGGILFCYTIQLCCISFITYLCNQGSLVFKSVVGSKVK